MPVTIVSRKKPPARLSESRLEMVMVRRSLEAANAIRAGNRKSLIASISMVLSLNLCNPPPAFRLRGTCLRFG